MHNQQKPAEDWETWEDDNIVTPIDHGEQVSIQTAAIPNSGRPSPSTTSNDTKISPPRESRQSGTKIKRLKSRQRQKAQNARAGIKVITDMSAFRKSHNRKTSRDHQAGKFADAVALRALEGEPMSASVGNWNWLKKNKQSPTSPPTASASVVTPSSGGILIGIEVDTDHARRLQAEPQTATNPYLVVPENLPSQKTDHQQSVWSPDTPETAYSFGSHLSPPRVRAASSVYSQNTCLMGQPAAPPPPPVPSMPETYKKAQGKLISIDLGNNRQSEIETPYTAFEEDDNASPLKSAKSKTAAKTPESATSRAHGWWDHVVSPFVESTVAFSTRQKPASKGSPVVSAYDKPWTPPSPAKEKEIHAPPRQPIKLTVPILREPIQPRRASPALSEAGSSTTAISAPYETRVNEKPRQAPASEVRSPADYPPPYSPPHNRNDAVRYRAVFPPGHPLGPLFPPSPRPASPLHRPASPGLAGTMTSQSPHGVQPPPRTYTPTLMHDRTAGTFIPQEHAYAAAGPMHRVERQRRRHEKEDFVARRLGSFWKGRGCVPQSGCFGRSKTGREGRKKRRLCAGLCCGITLLLILIIVLATVLTHNRASVTPPSIWVNLTDFPPMPTGVLSVLGPQNNATVSSCSAPSTLWSCSLPKEQQGANKPFRADQPNMVFQIQWDNSTSGSWKTPDGQKPVPVKRSFGLAALARSLARSVPFTPSPKPPAFQEMWFLGETTDGIQSDQKAGEPTPFYISVLPPSSNSSSSSASKPSKRDAKPPPSIIGNITLPAPALDSDGTPSGTVMLPNPSQQPIRLFDRGLPSEHYGFYSYFQRTIFLKSVNMLNRTETEGNIPLDKDGGCRKSEANYLTTWGETRFLVKIWTRKLGSTGAALIAGNGTMPYPVSVSLDTHGGDPNRKLVWEWPMNDRQKVDFSAPELLVNNMNTTGDWVNPRGMGDAKYGGFDGGSGGCRCEWVNWVSGTH